MNAKDAKAPTSMKPPRPRALVAFDKFKDALSAEVACALAARVLQEQRPEWEIDRCPLTDGGDGFAAILTGAARGRMGSFVVTGPRGAPVRAGIGIVSITSIPPAARAQLGLASETAPDASVAIVEMASASGLALLAADERNPWKTTSRGVGELIRAAADLGVAAIVLGVGGSATNDLGLGTLAVLGFEFKDADARALPDLSPQYWTRIDAIACHAAVKLPPLFMACDVANPLLGPRGAAAVFGPQKGLRREDVPAIERESERLARLLCRSTGASERFIDVPGAGAAGGIAFGLMAGVGAKLLPGFEFVSAWLDLDARLESATCVLTGEGRFDASSLGGKGPGALALRAAAAARTVHVFAGSVGEVEHPGIEVHAITMPGTPLPEALAATSSNLQAAIRRVFSVPCMVS